MTFFEKAFGFKELDYKSTQKKLLSIYENNKLNGIDVGIFNTYILKELKKTKRRKNGKVVLKTIFGDVGELHMKHKDAIFQVASQFNCLEFINPRITPEHGITMYEDDHTQGPVCAIACPAATAYRNYLVPLDDQLGQTKNKQIDLLGECDKLFDESLWKMKNGYMFSTTRQLMILNDKLKVEKWKQTFKDKVQVGVQVSAGVVKNKKQIHNVTQVFCSTSPINYQNIEPDLWEPVSRLLLESCYESTLWTAVHVNEKRKKEKKKPAPCFLTRIGGGVFGNKQSWIDDAISLAIESISKSGYNLEVFLVEYKNKET
jgi:hypothetical protein